MRTAERDTAHAIRRADSLHFRTDLTLQKADMIFILFFRLNNGVDIVKQIKFRIFTRNRKYVSITQHALRRTKPSSPLLARITLYIMTQTLKLFMGLPRYQRIEPAQSHFYINFLDLILIVSTLIA